MPLLMLLFILLSWQPDSSRVNGLAAESLERASESPRPAEMRMQVFSAAEEKVIGVVEVDEAVQREAELWLRSISGKAPEVKIDADCGYIFKIPLLKSVSVQTKPFTGTVRQVLLFYCPDMTPKLLLFSDNHQPHFVTFSHPLQPFLEQMNAYRFMKN
jgi:hypothetical protein